MDYTTSQPHGWVFFALPRPPLACPPRDRHMVSLSKVISTFGLNAEQGANWKWRLPSHRLYLFPTKTGRGAGYDYTYWFCNFSKLRRRQPDLLEGCLWLGLALWPLWSARATLERVGDRGMRAPLGRICCVGAKEMHIYIYLYLRPNLMISCYITRYKQRRRGVLRWRINITQGNRDERPVHYLCM